MKARPMCVWCQTWGDGRLVVLEDGLTADLNERKLGADDFGRTGREQTCTNNDNTTPVFCIRA